MQAAIGNSLIRSLKPADKPFEVRDTITKGLILRVEPGGTKTYYAEYARGKRLKLGRADVLTPVQAREKAKGVLADSYDGEEPEAAKRRKQIHTLRTWLDDEYLPWLRDNTQRATETEGIFKRAFPAMMTTRLADINALQVEKWKQARKADGLKESSINRELNALRACLSKAVAHGVLTVHPLSNVKRYKERDSKEIHRYLTPDEEKRLRLELAKRDARIRKGRESGNRWREERGHELRPEYVNARFVDHVEPMILVSLNTGLRRGELFALEWEEVDLRRGILIVKKTTAKSGKTRHVPLNDEAMAALKAWQEQTCDYSGLVFRSREGGQFDNINKAWSKLLQDAKITGFRWHDLRHSFASKLVTAGVDLNTVRELLGHSDYKLTLRYAHLAPDKKQEAVQKLLQNTPKMPQRVIRLKRKNTRALQDQGCE